MDEINRVFHGGIKDNNFTDFSISVNPISPPFVDKLFSKQAMKVNQRYTYIEWIEDSFRQRYGEDTVVLAGATEAFQIIGFTLMKDSEVVIPKPNYGEYSRVAHFSAQKTHFVDILDIDGKRLDYSRLFEYIQKENKKSRKITVIFSNPNNPTGYFESDLINYIKSFQAFENILFIVDEAFLDFLPEEERTDLSFLENVICVRTFTKFYGLPGIRVGYVKTTRYRKLFETFRAPWATGGCGYLFLKLLLQESRENLKLFEKRTIEFIKTERQKFQRYIYFPSKTNYFTVKIPDLDEFMDKLHRNKIHIRTLHDMGMPQFVRIGIKDQKSNEKLLKVMGEMLNA